MAKAPTSESWRSRIVDHGEVDPTSLLAHPLNWRTHPEHQRRALVDVLDQVGWVQDVIVNRRTGRIVDGHLRVSVARERGEATLPVVYVDLAEDEEALVLATLDPLSALATRDDAILEQLLVGVNANGDALGKLLAEVAPQAPRLAPASEKTYDLPPPTTRPGDLWELGRHRILCGDSTSPSDVAKLLDGVRVGGVFTSPPYDQQRSYEGRMAADWQTLMVSVADATLPHLADDAQVFVNLGLVHRGRVVRYWDPFLDHLEAAGWPLFGWYVWDKGQGIPGDFGGRFVPTHEWVFHFARRGTALAKTQPAKMAGQKLGSKRTRGRDGNLVTSPVAANERINEYKIHESVIHLPGQKPDELVNAHPAPFPVALPATFVEAWAGVDSWLDPFLGSGTTVIACEQYGRACYGLDLNPGYVDLAVRRWESYTGQVAHLVDS